MADFRKPKYSGSLNLAPECGPVLIELDTDAKTATASLEDPESQYTLAGGGGGELTYVIPEQTVTLTDHVATLEGVDVSSLNSGDYIIINIVYLEDDGYAAAQFENRVPGEEGFGEITIKDATYTIYAEDGNWLLYASVINSLTIKAIKIVNF